MAVMAGNTTTKATADELCPNCGEFVKRLCTSSGWCRSCSQTPKSGDNSSELEAWLVQNADHLEHYLSLGKSLNQAIDLLREDVRPTCLCCGAFITRAPRRTAVFCRRTVTCRKYSRRYVYLYSDKGLTKAEALAKVMQELSHIA